MRSDRVVDAARAVSLLAIVAAVYLAQHLFLNHSLTDIVPVRIARSAPFLMLYVDRRVDALIPFLLWIYAGGAILFGLLTPVWRDDYRLVTPPEQRGVKDVLKWQTWRYPAGAAAILTLVVSLFRLVGGLEWLSIGLWAAAVGLYLWTGIQLAQASLGVEGLIARLDRSPLAGWTYLVAILIAGSVAYTIRWWGLPTRIDVLTAEVGLLARGGGGEKFVSSPLSNLPALALSVTKIWSRITGNGLAGARIAGLMAGLLLTAAVWLLSAELFRRAHDKDEHAGEVENDVMLAKVLATAIAAFGLPTLLFARAPILLEGLVWGSLGLWALMYGLRTGVLPAVGFGAAFLGIASLYGPNGLVLIVVGAAIWAGVFVLKPEWPGIDLHNHQGLRQPELLYWISGLVLTLLPLFAGYATSGTGLRAYFQFNALVDSWRAANLGSVSFSPLSLLTPNGLDWLSGLLAPALPARSTGGFGLDAAMLSPIIAPLFVLGLGALVLNMDTVVGWTLASWIVVGAILGGVFAYPLASGWSSTLVIWPAAALATAFALDRLRTAINDFAGSWTRQAGIYLAFGLVITAAIMGWLSFYERSMSITDRASAVGREARRSFSAGKTPIISVSVPWTEEEVAVLAFVTDLNIQDSESLLVTAAELPTTLPRQARVIVSADESDLLAQIQSRYPDAQLTIIRVLGANPVVWTLSPSETVSP